MQPSQRPHDGSAVPRIASWRIRAIAARSPTTSRPCDRRRFASLSPHRDYAVSECVERPALRSIALNSFRRPSLPMIVLTLGSPIPLRRSVSARDAHVTAIAPPVARACALATGRARLRGPGKNGFRQAGSLSIALSPICASSGDFATDSERSRSTAPSEPAGPTIPASTATLGPSHIYSAILPHRPNILRLPRGSCYAGSMLRRKQVTENAASHTCACWRMRERAGAMESAREGCTPQRLYKDFPCLSGLPQPAVESPRVPDRMNTASIALAAPADCLRAGAPW